MTGGADGIIGFNKEDFMQLFLGRKPSRIRVSDGLASLNAVLVEMEAESRRALSIKRVHRWHEPSRLL
jgi:calcineurin-like phosphoesterase